MTVWTASEMLPMEIAPQQSCAHPSPRSGYATEALVFHLGEPGLGRLRCCQTPARAPARCPSLPRQALPNPQPESSGPLSPTQDKQLPGKCRLRDMYISRHALFSVFAYVLAVYLLPKLIVKLQKDVKPPEV